MWPASDDLQAARFIISAPFGRTAVHPMHLDLSDDTKQQIERLRTALPDR